MTVIGAGFMAFVSGLVVNASNAHFAVLGAMLISSVLSFVAAIFIVRAEKREEGAPASS